MAIGRWSFHILLSTPFSPHMLSYLFPPWASKANVTQKPYVEIDTPHSFQTKSCISLSLLGTDGFTSPYILFILSMQTLPFFSFQNRTLIILNITEHLSLPPRIIGIIITLTPSRVPCTPHAYCCSFPYACLEMLVVPPHSLGLHASHALLIPHLNRESPKKSANTLATFSQLHGFPKARIEQETF